MWVAGHAGRCAHSLAAPPLPVGAPKAGSALLGWWGHGPPPGWSSQLHAPPQLCPAQPARHGDIAALCRSDATPCMVGAWAAHSPLPARPRAGR